MLDAVREAAEYRLNPLPKQLGRKYGARFPAVRSAVLALDADSAAQRLLNGDSIELQIEGESVELLPSEVEVRISPKVGFATAADGAYVAALVTDIDQELGREGLANEVVRRVQELRKQAEFSVDDRIRLQYSGTRELMEAIEAHRAHISAETLSLSMEYSEEPTGIANAEYQFQDMELRIAISRSATR